MLHQKTEISSNYKNSSLCSWRNFATSTLDKIVSSDRGEDKKTVENKVSIRILESNRTIAEGRKNPDSSYSILLSNGLFQKINNPSTLKFVLAHEYAHVKYNHFAPNLENYILSEKQRNRLEHIYQEWELKADSFAINSLTKTERIEGRENITQIIQETPVENLGKHTKLFKRHPDPKIRTTTLWE